MSENDKTKKLQRPNQICVRLSEKQYQKIYKKSQMNGQSMASIIRQSWLKRPPTKYLLDKDAGEKLIKEMNRLGTRVNEIAKKVNAGIGHRWSEELDEVNESLSAMVARCKAAYDQK